MCFSPSVTATDGRFNDTLDLSDLKLDSGFDSECDLSGYPADFRLQPESQLCIPQDKLEDLELFPNFTDDFICLSEILLDPVDENFVHCFAADVEDCKAIPERGFPATPEQGTEEKRRVLFKESSHFDNRRNIGVEFPIIGKKKTRKRRADSSENSAASVVKKKKCSHCQVEETPLWRNGPMGPKTLCNACGVRYRSGRLVPAYRPARSPNFNSLKHSNYHRKIMRRKVTDD